MSKNCWARIARLVSHILNPAYLALMLLLVIGIACPAARTSSAGMYAWWICLCLLAILPACTAQESLLLRRLPLVPLDVRRTISFIASLLSYVACFVTVLLIKAPPIFIAIAGSYLGTVLLLIAANLFFRASGHGGAVSGPVVALNLLFPGWGLLSLPLLAVVAWARLAAKEHTPLQIVGGMAIGAFSTIMAFLLVRPIVF